jgi:hypothetical protein
MFIMRPNDIERAIIHLPTELINKSTLMVTEHFLERPRSLNERFVRIFIGPKRKSVPWNQFVDEPAAEICKVAQHMDNDDIIKNILEMRPAKLLYAIRSSSNTVVKNIQ